MILLCFAGQDALRVALSSELVPAEVQRAGARVLREEGPEATTRIWVSPLIKLPKAAKTALEQAGIEFSRKEPEGWAEARKVGCWAELLAPTWVGDREISCALALFALAEAKAALPLAGELLRLGCDRQELAFGGTGDDAPPALLRAVAPPYYTLLRALDDPRGARVFLPTPAGQERIWTQLGYEHPLVRSLDVGDGLLLVTGEGRFLRCSPGSWRDLYQLLELRLPEAEGHEPTATPTERLSVELSLLPLARSATPTFWVLRTNAVAVVDGLVRHLPEGELSRLSFAAVDGEGEEPLILLRARSGRRRGVQLHDLPEGCESYAPYREIEHLLVPADALVEPPLRRQTLEELLAPDAEQVTWLRPSPEDPRRFSLERVAEAAFTPLSEWIDYVVDRDAETLEHWARSALFDFAAYESIGVEWADGPAAPPAPEPAKKGRRKRQAADEEVFEAQDELTPYVAEVADEPVEEEELRVSATPLARSAEQDRVSALEQRFLELDAPAEDAQRVDLWRELGRGYVRLGRERDAALSFTRALWELDGDDARAAAQLWAQAAARLASAREPLALLDAAAADVAAVRAVVAWLVAAELAGSGPDGPTRQRVALWLDANDEALDVRSLWLSRLALARLAGGDALLLVRARDRALGRLFRGLSLERDVPTFLRFTGGEGGHDAATIETLAQQLETLLTRYGKTRRKPSAVEAPEALTRGYVLFSFAWGFARLGQPERARALRDEALAAVDESDAIHGYLRQAYTERIDQALEGQPAETPLSRELSGRLNELERFPRYKVDRLRQASAILEPQERLDPVLAFQQDQSDPRGPEFAALRGMRDADELSGRVQVVMAQALASETSVEDKARLLDGVMDFFPMLPEAEAVPHLRLLMTRVDDVPAPRRYQLYEEALMLAGLFGRQGLARELVERSAALLGELSAEHVAELGASVGEGLRSLRRVGLRDEAGQLLAGIDRVVRGDSPDALVCRVQLGAGRADLGQHEAAQQAFREAQAALEKGGLMPVDRLRVTRALAVAYAHMPLPLALGGLEHLAAQLPDISDSFNTNSHFCLSVISFMESLILGYAADELALGELGRHWQDEDEYLVRRRIHKEAP